MTWLHVTAGIILACILMPIILNIILLIYAGVLWVWYSICDFIERLTTRK